MTISEIFIEYFYSAITFNIVNAFISKIIAIILSSIRFSLYLSTFIFLKNWDKETEKIEKFCVFQFIWEIFILLISVFILIFSRYLNRKVIYHLFLIITTIITIYLFFSLFIDICMVAEIKYKEFPDLFQLNTDPLLNYTDDISSISLKNFINKNTNKIDISLINDEIFNFTYLEKSYNQIYVPDPKYFKINFIDKSIGNLEPSKKRHRFEFNKEMIIQIINTILGVLSFFLWKSIRFKHKKLIQNRVFKKFGKKITFIETGINLFFVIPIPIKNMREEELKKEIKESNDYVLYSLISCFDFLEAIMELISFYGSLIVFIVLIVLRSKRSFINKVMHFPFSLTYLGENLYFYLLIFLIVSFGIYVFFLAPSEVYLNHYENKDNNCKKYGGTVILFTIGIIYLFFSICGILGTLFFIVGNTDSNSNLYIKSACKDSDISCYGLFKFDSSFGLNNEEQNYIFYYIYLREISRSDKAKNMASLITILLIYFCQFYYILWKRILIFNCEKKRYGSCLVHDYIITNSSDIFLTDKIILEKTNEYYKNCINDSFFNIPKSNNKMISKNERKKEEIVENKCELPSNGRMTLPPINTNVIKFSSNLRTNSNFIN